MAAIANITVFDGAATPVSHVLVPISVTREKDEITAIWRESLTTLPDYAQVRLTAKLKRLPSKVWRVETKAEVPVMEAVAGQNASGYTAAPKVAYVDTMQCIGFFHERSLITGHRLVRQLLVNVMGNISTTVAPATTGPLPDLFDALVAPN